MAALKDTYLSRLKGTETEVAFERGGERKFREYQALEVWRDADGAQQDVFFTELLGSELAQQYIEANGIVYGSKINLNNVYISWGIHNYGPGKAVEVDPEEAEEIRKSFRNWGEW